MSLPILYSFRRCPYAMRARLALHLAKVEVEHREILLKNKPAEMLEASPKGTVPVLVLDDNQVLDESRDVAIWALRQSPNHHLNWGVSSQLDQQQLALIDRNDQEFKYWLDRYKYHVGYPENSQEHYREKAEIFLSDLEQSLSNHKNLFGEQASFADIAIFPFVRQFAFVDKPWFDNSPYPSLQRWLSNWIESDLFSVIMVKHPEWVSEKSHKT